MSSGSTGAITTASTPIVIKIRGAVESKKDKLRPSRIIARGRKGMHYDQQTTDGINRLVIQIRAAWRNRPMVEHPHIKVEFTFPHHRRDRDGCLATILDGLKVAGVIADDSCKFCNGPIELLPAIIDKNAEEGATITIQER